MNVGLHLSDDVLEQIAQRAAAIVLGAQQVDNGRPPWLTLAQAAEQLDCSVDAVRMRVKRGRLESRRHGRRLYVSAESVKRLA